MKSVVTLLDWIKAKKLNKALSLLLIMTTNGHYKSFKIVETLDGMEVSYYGTKRMANFHLIIGENSHYYVLYDTATNINKKLT